jgi:kynurenine formamidase
MEMKSMKHMTRFIDLSVPIEANSGEPNSPKILRISHQEGAAEFCARFNADKKRFLDGGFPGVGLTLEPTDFPGGEFLSNEIVTAGVHSGTHMDAPFHYGSYCGGKKSCTIDNIPLEWCFGNGVVLDLSGKPPRSSISREDIRQALQKINYTPRELDIVLIRTDSDKKWGTPAYFTDYPGMGRDAVLFLLEQGIKIMGIDSYGFDRPFPVMLSDYLQSRDQGVLWPAHFLGRELEYFHMERMANLDKLPIPYNFKVACFPVKITGAGAAWVRPVAILEDTKENSQASLNPS